MSFSQNVVRLFRAESIVSSIATLNLRTICMKISIAVKIATTA